MSEQRVAKKASRTGGWITRSLLLILLLCLAALGAAGYYYGLPLANQLLDERDSIKASIAELEVTHNTALDAIPEQIDAAITERLAAVVQERDKKLSQLTREVARMTASEQRLKEALARAEAQLERQSGVDQAAWRTAEAEFNVRMASQRLQVARDVTAALVLLRGADQLLAGVDTGKAESLRRLVASNIAALSALPQVDRIGLLSQLQALEQQVGQLELVSLGFEPQPLSGSASGNPSDSPSFLQQAIGVLSSYFVVTTLESSEVRPLPSEWAALAQSSLTAMFEQARLALLMGDQTNFVASVDRARLFTEQHSRADDSRATSVVAALAALRQVDIAPALPDLSETQRVFRDEPPPTPDALADSVGEGAK
jgi:uroporphyrin-3 C-methyltransferase